MYFYAKDDEFLCVCVQLKMVIVSNRKDEYEFTHKRYQSVLCFFFLSVFQSEREARGAVVSTRAVLFFAPEFIHIDPFLYISKISDFFNACVCVILYIFNALKSGISLLLHVSDDV